MRPPGPIDHGRREAVVAPPRHEVRVEVEDVLPARRTVRLDEGEAVGLEHLAEPVCDADREPPDVVGILALELPDVGDVTTGDHEGVALAGRVDVEERDGAIALHHDLRGFRARSDRAEHTGPHRW